MRKAGPFKICPPKIPTWIQSLHISGLWTSNPYKPTRPTQNFKRKKLVDGSVDSVEIQKISHFLYSLTLTFSNLSLKSEPGSSLLADVAQVRRRRFKFHVAQSAGADSRRCPFVVALAVLRWVSNSTSLLWSTWNLLLMLWSVHFDGGSVNVVLGFLVWILISLFWVLKCCCAWDPRLRPAPSDSTRTFGRPRVYFPFTRCNRVGWGSDSNPTRPVDSRTLHSWPFSLTLSYLLTLNYSPKQNDPSFIISTSCILLYIYYNKY